MLAKQLYQYKKIFVFDLDGTLTESKGLLDKEMSDLLEQLLEHKRVAVISGGSYKQFNRQFLSQLRCRKVCLSNLYLFPTNATKFLKYKNGWEQVYEEKLSQEDKKQIITALKDSLEKAGYQKPKKTYGEIIEDRNTQITFSGLGQEAPLKEKNKWDTNHTLRDKIITEFEKRLPKFDAQIGGSTSIDINKKNIDKAYGIRQIKKHLGIPIKNMLFVGDSLFVGGNDYSVIKTGIDTIAVKGPEETKNFIRSIL